MKHPKHLYLIFFLSIALLSKLNAQKIWQNTSLVGGFALGAQDRRLFDYPDAENVLEHEKDKIDFSLTLSLQKRILKYGKFELEAGLGYTESTSFFSRPFDQSRIGGGTSLEVRHIKKYSLNKIFFPISMRYYLNKTKKYFVKCSVFPAICFRKVAIDSKKFTDWQFKPNSLEINPALGYRLNKNIQLTLYYRLFNFHEVDKVIFSQSLYNEPVPPFLEQKVDCYNPFEIWFTVEYKLGK